ncbi:MAG: hypothetical protein IJD06_00320 [Clostridia bacterium]|nr:hypothetical protein [Clostridia bacterium]
MKHFIKTIHISRRRLTVLLLFLGTAALLISTLYLYDSLHTPAPSESTPVREPSAVYAAPAPALCILREYEQKIGIFEEGQRTPFQILDVYVFTLPAADQKALQHGIRISSEKELLARIEDFTG